MLETLEVAVLDQALAGGFHLPPGQVPPESTGGRDSGGQLEDRALGGRRARAEHARNGLRRKASVVTSEIDDSDYGAELAAENPVADRAGQAAAPVFQWAIERDPARLGAGLWRALFESPVTLRERLGEA